jgi:hypothetical protein
VNDDHQRREQVAAGQDPQPGEAQDAVLAEQHDRGDQIADRQGRLIGGNEGIHRRQLHARERRGGAEREERQQHDRAREPALAPAGRQRR